MLISLRMLTNRRLWSPRWSRTIISLKSKWCCRIFSTSITINGVDNNRYAKPHYHKRTNKAQDDLLGGQHLSSLSPFRFQFTSVLSNFVTAENCLWWKRATKASSHSTSPRSFCTRFLFLLYTQTASCHFSYSFFCHHNSYIASSSLLFNCATFMHIFLALATAG